VIEKPLKLSTFRNSGAAADCDTSTPSNRAKLVPLMVSGVERLILTVAGSGYDGFGSPSSRATDTRSVKIIIRASIHAARAS